MLFPEVLMPHYLFPLMLKKEIDTEILSVIFAIKNDTTRISVLLRAMNYVIRRSH